MANEFDGGAFRETHGFQIPEQMAPPHANEIQRAQKFENQLKGQERTPGSSLSKTALGSQVESSNNLRPFSSEGDWQEGANCLGVDPDLFFPERGASTREAKEVCRKCEVRLDCLEYALVNGEKFGIWGGMSARERRRLSRQRAQATRRTII